MLTAWEVWDLSSRQSRWRVKAHKFSVSCITFSNSDAILVSGSREEGTVYSWHSDAGEKLHTFQIAQALSAFGSPIHSLFIVTTGSHALVCDAARGYVFALPDVVRIAAFMRAGRSVITAGLGTETLKTWDLQALLEFCEERPSNGAPSVDVTATLVLATTLLHGPQVCRAIAWEIPLTVALLVRNYLCISFV